MYNRPRCTRLGVVAIEGTYLTRVKVICVQGDDVGVVRMEEFHHIQKRADLVREKNGELLDEWPVNF